MPMESTDGLFLKKSIFSTYEKLEFYIFMRRMGYGNEYNKMSTFHNLLSQ